MLKYFTVLSSRYEIGQLKKTFCENVFVKKNADTMMITL